MAGTGPGDLFDLAEVLLDAATEALDTIPTYEPGLAGAPARSFVTYGTPALDCCNQLTVHVAAVAEDPLSPSGPASGQRARFDARKNSVTLVLTVTRCVPTEIPPPVDEVEAASRQTLADAWALWNNLWNQIRAGDLLTLCSDSRPDLRPLQPSGGCAGWVMAYRVWLEGYEEP